MQPTGIRSAQFLLEVIAGAQDKIGQDISKTGFSQQLSEQHQLIQTTPFGQPATATDQANQAQKSLAASKEMPSASPAGDYARSSEQPANCSSKIQTASLPSAPARNLVMSKWRAAQELAFTDPMALEKVLSQLHLAPSVRTAIKSAFNDQGQISLQKLSEILDRAASGKSDLPGDGKAATDEILSLLAGMVQQQQPLVQNLRQLGIRLKGSYDLGEFRNLLRRLIEQTASGEIEQSATSPLARTSELSSATSQTAADARFTSRSILPNQTESLSANLIPSFLRDDQGPSHDAHSRTTNEASSGLSNDGSSKIRALAAGKIAQKEELISDQQGKQFKGAANSLSAGVDSASPTSIAGDLQRVSPTLISTDVLNRLSETISNAASDLKTLGNEGLQLNHDIETIIIPKANLEQDILSMYAEGQEQAVTSAPANMAVNGEAIIRGLRLNSIQSGLSSESNLFEGTLSDRLSTPSVEKIAAPGSADFTSNQSGTSENGAFSSNGSATSSTLYMERPFGTPTEPAISNNVMGRPVEHMEALFRDVIRYRIEPSPIDMRQDAASSDPAGTGQADKSTPNVTFSGSTGNSQSLSQNFFNVIPDLIQNSDLPGSLDSGLRRNDGYSEILQGSRELSQGPRELSSTAAPLDSLPTKAIPEQPDPLLSQTGGRTAVSDPTGIGQADKPIPNVTFPGSTGDGQSRLQSSFNVIPTLIQNSDLPGSLDSGLRRNDGYSEIFQGPRELSQGPRELSQGPRELSQGPRELLQGPRELSSTAAPPDSLPTKAVPTQSDPLQSQSGGISEEGVSLSSLNKSPLQAASALSEQVESSKDGPVVESKAAPKVLDGGVNNLESLPRGPTREQSGANANSIAEQSTAGKPSNVVPSASTETGSNVHAPFSQETLSGGARPELQNSVELLARSETSSEATAGRNGTASKEIADQATRTTSLESSVKEISTDKSAEKGSQGSNTSGQFSQHEQGQEGALSLYRDGMQMAKVATAPSAQTAQEIPSYYASALTAELAERIKELYKQKGFQFTMELEPKHLGRLMVRIGAGARLVKASITTESEQARELLSRSSPQLRQELASQGLVLDQLQIDVNSQGAAYDQFFQKDNDNSRRNRLSHQSAGPEKGSAEPSARRAQASRTDTLISVFV